MRTPCGTATRCFGALGPVGAEAAGSCGTSSPLDCAFDQALPRKKNICQPSTPSRPGIARSSSALSCWLRNQASCRSSRFTTGADSQRDSRPSRNCQATSCRPVSRRRVMRSVAPSKASAEGTTPLSCTSRRSSSHCRISVCSVSARSIAASLCSRLVVSALTARQAITDITAITTSATTTSISVNPRAARRKEGPPGRRISCAPRWWSGSAAGGRGRRRPAPRRAGNWDWASSGPPA